MDNNSLEQAYLRLAKEEQIFQISLQLCAARIAAEIARLLTVSRVSIWISGDDDDTSLLHNLSVFDTDSQASVQSAVVGKTFCPQYSTALGSARYLQVKDIDTDSRTQDRSALCLSSENVQSLFDVTLRTHGNTKGLLRLEMRGQTRGWKQEETMFVTALADLFSQRLIVDELARSEGEYKSLYEYTSEGVAVFGGVGFIDVNPATCKMFGGSREQILGKTPGELSPEFQSDGQLSESRAKAYIGACLAGTPQNFEWTHKRIDGTEFDVNITLNTVRFAGNDTLFAMMRDISEKKNAEKRARAAGDELSFRAAHDLLTGLRNRDQLHYHLSQLIDRRSTACKNSSIALLLLDLNRFKEVNDTLGHANGDKVLIKLAGVLNAHVSDIGGDLFRLGGDEFVVVLDAEQCSDSFSSIDARLHQCLKTSIALDDVRIEMSASIGIALYPENGEDSHELLRCAEVAMYNSKSNEGTTSWYDPQNDPNNKRRLAMIVELGSAISNNELTLHFQPKISVSTGEVTGCEALIRWQHPKHGLVSPAEFIPLAEVSELIHPLSEWVLRSAISQVKKLDALGYRVPVAVNISGRNLTDTRLVDSLREMIATQGIDPGLLEIELTESALINHPQRAIENLEKLGELGIKIAIDDFGTGYSSLSYLKKLPLNTLKIDRSFVKDMLTDDSDSVIVDSTINLAHNFSLIVVAEGVEDQETMNGLDAKSCDQAQGFFIARPMPADDLLQWLNQHFDQPQALRKVS